MQIIFTPSGRAGSTQIRLISGSISKFVEREGVIEYHVGYGSKKPLPQRKVILFLRKIIVLSKQNKLRSIALQWRDIRGLADRSIVDKKLGELVATAFHMADFEFTVYKKEPEGGFDRVDEVLITDVPKPAIEGVCAGRSSRWRSTLAAHSATPQAET
jgi:hypothetical protein